MAEAPQTFDPEESFDETWYIRNYADIAEAVALGRHPTGRQHYVEHGRAEGRHPYDPRILALLEQANEATPGTLFSWDEFLVAEGGGLILGWLDNRSDAVTELILQPYFGPPADLLPRLIRHRRDDVAEMLGVPSNAFDYGIAIPLDPVAPGLPPLGAQLAIRFASGRAASRHLPARRIGPEELRNRVLEMIALGANRPLPDPELGDIAGPLARRLDQSAWQGAGPTARIRFGPSDAQPALSIVVVGPGAPQRQAAFFAATEGVGRAEFIFVEAGRGPPGIFAAQVETANVLYGLDATALCPAAPPGLARGRNEGAGVARGAHLLFLSPACIPTAPDWLDRALAAADSLSGRGLAGAALLDEDDAIVGCGVRLARDPRTGLFRAESPLAGLPRAFLPEESRPADAVAADAMLVPASFFRELGGFSADFLLGGGGLDLCQRVLDADAPVLVDPRLLFRRLPVGAPPSGKSAEGAARLNHARFNELWGAVLAEA